MIKIGEMKVNSNIKPKTYLILIVFAIILLTFMIGNTIFNYKKTKDYIKENAIITDKYAEYYQNFDDETNYNNYIEFDYEYNHQTYHNKQRVAFLFNKKIGDEVTIYINPNDPDEVKNMFNTRAFYGGDVILIVWLILAIKAYKIRKQQEMPN